MIIQQSKLHLIYHTKLLLSRNPKQNYHCALTQRTQRTQRFFLDRIPAFAGTSLHCFF